MARGLLLLQDRVDHALVRALAKDNLEVRDDVPVELGSGERRPGLVRIGRERVGKCEGVVRLW